jgi:MFS family permease
MAIVMNMFSEGAERNKALGIWGALGGTVGLLDGGILTTYVGWRYIFFFNVPIGATTPPRSPAGSSGPCGWPDCPLSPPSLLPSWSSGAPRASGPPRNSRFRRLAVRAPAFRWPPLIFPGVKPQTDHCEKNRRKS